MDYIFLTYLNRFSLTHELKSLPSSLYFPIFPSNIFKASSSISFSFFNLQTSEEFAALRTLPA